MIDDTLRTLNSPSTKNDGGDPLPCPSEAAFAAAECREGAPTCLRLESPTRSRLASSLRRAQTEKHPSRSSNVAEGLKRMYPAQVDHDDQYRCLHGRNLTLGSQRKRCIPPVSFLPGTTCISQRREIMRPRDHILPPETNLKPSNQQRYLRKAFKPPLPARDDDGTNPVRARPTSSSL